MPARPSSADKLTRRQVAARLGVSVSSVRRMEYRELHPEKGLRGTLFFRLSEVESLESRRPSVRPARPTTRERSDRLELDRRGRIAARVFQMFANGWTLPRIVLATKQPPDVIRSLYHEWVTPLQEHEWQGTTSRPARR